MAIGYMAMWLHGYMAKLIYGFMAVRLYGYVCMYGYMAIWLTRILSRPTGLLGPVLLMTSKLFVVSVTSNLLSMLCTLMVLSIRAEEDWNC